MRSYSSAIRIASLSDHFHGVSCSIPCAIEVIEALNRLETDRSLNSIAETWLVKSGYAWLCNNDFPLQNRFRFEFRFRMLMKRMKRAIKEHSGLDFECDVRGTKG